MKKPTLRPDYDALRKFADTIPDTVKSINSGPAKDGSGTEVTYTHNGQEVRKVIPFKPK